MDKSCILNQFQIYAKFSMNVILLPLTIPTISNINVRSNSAT
jgi:hypothetical protein